MNGGASQAGLRGGCLARSWREEIPPHGLAAFRILFGIFLAAYFLSWMPHVTLLFSREGVYLPVGVPDIAPPPGIAWLIYAASLGAIALFTAGYRTALLAPVVLAAFLYHWCLNLAVKDTAYDRLIIILLLLSSFARLDGAWALGRPSRGLPVPAWPAVLLRLQLALLYFGAGLWKLLSPAWHRGEMMEMTLAGPWGTPAAAWLVGLGWPGALYTLLAFGVIAFELALGFALYVRPTRKLAMALGILFHASVGLLLGIPEFLVCTAVYALFLDPREVQRAGERVGRVALALQTLYTPPRHPALL
jgi:hypothetical protein